MTRKKENYKLWLEEKQERHRIRNAKRRALEKLKKNAKRTWKPGCLITFKSFYKGKTKIFVCRMKKTPNHFNAHTCRTCVMINNGSPCLNCGTSMGAKCMIKRPLDVFPVIIGFIDKHRKYHRRNNAFLYEKNRLQRNAEG